MSDLEKKTSALPGPWPWYVLLLIGHCVCGLLPWLMVLWASFRRGNKRTALIGLAVNLAIFALLSFYVVEARTAWWRLELWFIAFDKVWALSAWVFQKKTIGDAPARYVWSEWTQWIWPFVIGLLVGVSFFIIKDIPGALSVRHGLFGASPLSRESVLWGFLANACKGIIPGTLLGLWWAGEHKRFSPSHIVTFLAASLALLIFITLLSLGMPFLLTKGATAADLLYRMPQWSPAPPWIGGLPKIIEKINEEDTLFYVVIPLLFGAAWRIRDYFKNLLWLPLIFLITLPFVYTFNQWWGVIQGRVIHEMYSPDAKTRASAYGSAEEILARYPDHLKWPLIAEAVARYDYECGRYEASQKLYRTIVERFKGSNEWYRQVRDAQAALDSHKFGNRACLQRINVPVADYESYLTANWMAMLSTIMYWQGPKCTESDVEIKLKALSTSDDKIALNPLTTMADLYDAAASLNYDVAIRPTDMVQIRELLRAGFPVVLVDRGRFHLVYGFDPGRSALLFYAYSRLSYQTRHQILRNDAGEIFASKANGGSKSKKRLERIRLEASDELGVTAPKDPSLQYRAPFMAIVYPRSKGGQLAAALHLPLDAVDTQTRGYLAGFIGLAFLHHADPVQALKWAKIGNRLIGSSFPLYVGELSRLYWEARTEKVRTPLAFANQFPELEEIDKTFSSADNAAFLQEAQHRFDEDFQKGALPYFLLDEYQRTLAPYDPKDLKAFLDMARWRVASDPSDALGWRDLVGGYEYAKDPSGKITALEGLVAVNPMNYKAKVDLACALILHGDYGRAQSALGTVDPEKLRFDSDYLFCMGALCEWKKKPDRALEYYKEAIGLCRWKPVYYFHYGRLLLAKGKKKRAEAALGWAAAIDAGGNIKRRAQKLLAGAGLKCAKAGL